MFRKLAAALMMAVLAASCGGSSKKATTATTRASGATTTTSGSGSSSAGVILGARIRLVNLFAGDNGPVTLEVDPGLTAATAGSHPAATVVYGQASDPFHPPGSSEGAQFSIYQLNHVTDAERLIQVTQTFKTGDDVLMVLYAGDKNGAGHITGSIQTFFLAGGPSTEATTTVAGKAYLLVNAGALQHIGSSGLAFNIGTPGKGCLTKTGNESQGVLVGGTQTVAYLVDPGTIQLAAYSANDTSCSGTPVVSGSVETETGNPLWVFLYGTSQQDIKVRTVNS
jgi:hypothetical protein